MANKKRKPITLDSNEEGKQFDTLFPGTGVGKVSTEPEKKQPNRPSEVRLQQFEKIKDYFKEDQNQKQYSYYLPEALQKMIKRHAVLEDKTISQVTKELYLEHYLTDAEIKAAYNEEYDKRNGLK